MGTKSVEWDNNQKRNVLKIDQIELLETKRQTKILKSETSEKG